MKSAIADAGIDSLRHHLARERSRFLQEINRLRHTEARILLCRQNFESFLDSPDY